MFDISITRISKFSSFPTFKCSSIEVCIFSDFHISVLSNIQMYYILKSLNFSNFQISKYSGIEIFKFLDSFRSSFNR